MSRDDAQARALAEIRAYSAIHHRAPSYRELARRIGRPVSSTYVIAGALARDGLIAIGDDGAIAGPADGIPEALAALRTIEADFGSAAVPGLVRQAIAALGGA